MKRYIICDIDGTLCTPARPDWSDVQSAKPIAATVLMMRELQQKYHVLIVTGRPQRVRQETLIWLEHQQLYPDALLMRPDKLTGSSAAIKTWLLEGALDRPMQLIAPEVVVALEDDPEVIRTYTSAGIPVLKVEL